LIIVMAGATALHPTGILCLGQRAFDPLGSAPAETDVAILTSCFDDWINLAPCGSSMLALSKGGEDLDEIGADENAAVVNPLRACQSGRAGFRSKQARERIGEDQSGGNGNDFTTF
jgi:hypothetical protein